MVIKILFGETIMAKTRKVFNFFTTLGSKILDVWDPLSRLLKMLKDYISASGLTFAGSSITLVTAFSDVIELYKDIYESISKAKKERDGKWALDGPEKLDITAQVTKNGKWKASGRIILLVLRVIFFSLALILGVTAAILSIAAIFFPPLGFVAAILGAIGGGSALLYAILNNAQKIIDYYRKEGFSSFKDIFSEPVVLGAASISLGLLSFLFTVASVTLLGCGLAMPLPVSLVVLSILVIGMTLLLGIGFYKFVKTADFSDKGQDYVEKQASLNNVGLEKMAKLAALIERIKGSDKNPDVKIEKKGNDKGGEDLVINGSEGKVNVFLGLLKNHGFFGENANAVITAEDENSFKKEYNEIDPQLT